jgi:CHAD domain-containing protein
VLAGAALCTYHQLRIECKRLRYAMEFFQELLAPEAPGLIKLVVGAQDLLGDLQDASVAEFLVAAFLKDQARIARDTPRLAPLDGAAQYLVAQWVIQRDLLGRFPAHWGKIAGYDFRRNLGLAVAAL